MKKMLLIILIITLPLVGCISKQESQERNMPFESSKKTKVDIDIEKLIVISKILSEDEKFYEIEIEIENKTGHPFRPTGIFLRPVIKEDGETQAQEKAPILVKSKKVIANENFFVAKHIVPKTLFGINLNAAKDSLILVVEGQFLNKNGQIIRQLGKGIFLN